MEKYPFSPDTVGATPRSRTYDPTPSRIDSNILALKSGQGKSTTMPAAPTLRIPNHIPLPLRVGHSQPTLSPSQFGSRIKFKLQDSWVGKSAANLAVRHDLVKVPSAVFHIPETDAAHSRESYAEAVNQVTDWMMTHPGPGVRPCLLNNTAAADSQHKPSEFTGETFTPAFELADTSSSAINNSGVSSVSGHLGKSDELFITSATRRDPLPSTASSKLDTERASNRSQPQAQTKKLMLKKAEALKPAPSVELDAVSTAVKPGATWPPMSGKHAQTRLPCLTSGMTKGQAPDLHLNESKPGANPIIYAEVKSSDLPTRSLRRKPAMSLNHSHIPAIKSHTHEGLIRRNPNIEGFKRCDGSAFNAYHEYKPRRYQASNKQDSKGSLGSTTQPLPYKAAALPKPEARRAPELPMLGYSPPLSAKMNMALGKDFVNPTTTATTVPIPTQNSRPLSAQTDISIGTVEDATACSISAHGTLRTLGGSTVDVSTKTKTGARTWPEMAAPAHVPVVARKKPIATGGAQVASKRFVDQDYEDPAVQLRRMWEEKRRQAKASRSNA